MNHWLTHIPHLLRSHSSFVIATLWAIDGSSPDSVGARLVITGESCFGQLHSSHRQHTIISQSRAILQDNECERLKKEYPLGEIAGAANGTSTVVYEKFTYPYANWLLSLENTMQYNGKAVLKNTVTDSPVGITSSWDVVPSEPGVDIQGPTMVHHSDHSHTLSEAVKLPEFRVAVVGDSAVAKALIDQLHLLPISTHWLSEQNNSGDTSIPGRQRISDNAIDKLPENTHVAIATKTHELDIHCCYHALLNKQLSYIGCLGSVRKFAVVERRLTEMGINEERLKQLTMPIGLPEITGKQPAIIAASIVAQLLSMHDHYFSA